MPEAGCKGTEKRGKKQIAAVAELVIVLLVSAALFAWAIRAALAGQGGGRCGGEYTLLLIPEIYYLGKRIVSDCVRDLFPDAP